MMKISQIAIIFLLLVSFLSFMPTAKSAQLYLYVMSWDGSQWTSPVKVTTMDYANATEFSYQNKIFKNYDNNYFAFYFNMTHHNIFYAASSDRQTWTTNEYDSVGGGFSKYPLGGIYLIPPPAAGLNGSIYFTGSDGNARFYNRITTTGLTVNVMMRYSLAAQNTTAIFGFKGLDGLGYDVYHRWVINFAYSLYSLNQEPNNQLYTKHTQIPWGRPDKAGSSGGCYLLNYKTSEPYHRFTMAKGNDTKLYWTIVNGTNPSQDFISDPLNELDLKMGVGYNKFAAVTEAIAIGEPEIIHTVFGNDTGIYYMTFESDAWSSLTDTGAAGGADYITLAIDTDANLVMTYVLGGILYYKTKTPAGSWSDAAVASSAVESVAYTSSNQYEQGGEILIEFTGVDYTEPTGFENVNSYFAYMLPVLGVGAFVVLIAAAANMARGGPEVVVKSVIIMAAAGTMCVIIIAFMGMGL